MAKAVTPRRNSHDSSKHDDQIFSFSRKKATEFFRRECEVRRENSEEFAKPTVTGCCNREYESAQPFVDGEYHVPESSYRFRTTGMNSTTGKSLSLDRGDRFEPGKHFAGDLDDSTRQVMPLRHKRTNKERRQKTKSVIPNPTFNVLIPYPRNTCAVFDHKIHLPIKNKKYRHSPHNL